MKIQTVNMELLAEKAKMRLLAEKAKTAMEKAGVWEDIMNYPSEFE